MSSVEKKAETPKVADENSEKKDDKANGDAKAKVDESEEAKKADEVLEQKLKEIQKNKPRFAPNIIPGWELEQLREGSMWNIRIFPVDQEDSKNCILESATKLAQKSVYYLPRRRIGQGVAELFAVSNKDAHAVMSRVVRTTFCHRYVTIELTRRSQERRGANAPYKKIEETATLVLDTTRGEKIKNTVISKEDQKSLWVRYLTDNTSPEFLRVLFPLSQNTQIQTHDNLRIGLVEANSKPDLTIFMKAYVTVVINNQNILSLHNKEPTEKESETKTELEKAVPPLADLKQAPSDVTDKQNQRRDDKSETARIMKRTMNQQQSDQPPSKRGRMEQPGQRGAGGSWGGSQFGSSVDFRGNRVGFGGNINPRAVTAEMMMMQARLNQTIRSQLMMLSSGNRRGGGGFNSGFTGGRFNSSAGGLRGVRGQKGFGGGW